MSTQFVKIGVNFQPKAVKARMPRVISLPRVGLIGFLVITLATLSDAYLSSPLRSSLRQSPTLAVNRPISSRSSTWKMMASSLPLHDPATREEKYKGNTAQYLVDLHDQRSVFDFCGGMLFQLILSDKLRSHLAGVADGGEQPIVYDATTDRMMKMPGIHDACIFDDMHVHGAISHTSRFFF